MSVDSLKKEIDIKSAILANLEIAEKKRDEEDKKKIESKESGNLKRGESKNIGGNKKTGSNVGKTPKTIVKNSSKYE